MDTVKRKPPSGSVVISGAATEATSVGIDIRQPTGGSAAGSVPGTFLLLEGGNGTYEVTIQNLDGPRRFQGAGRR